MGFAVLVFLLLLGVIFISTAITVYNGLIGLKNQIDRAWANIDVILKQRFDEIPQLVQILEQYIQYEKAVIQKVSDARAHYGAARTADDKIKAAGEMSVALKGVVAIGEGYPELKSNANFVQIQSRLSALEDHLADRREIYNEAVTNWNTRIAQFPELFFAGALGFTSKPLYQISVAETQLPNLKIKTGF